ncbi:conserved hypothetical protein [Sulfolobus islandicus Y.G.57.14]|uniref:Uncharacterized protein n=1 Tax=Saccharolobus islandicus (strain Y.G.57.14 / Yellowstone \|nr:hypothetical protein [Sulfolobus islandicus]ACP44711.1 conserved hypothetical protein [Sulfolobus islandicus Y.G.57.14]
MRLIYPILAIIIVLASMFTFLFFTHTIYSNLFIKTHSNEERIAQYSSGDLHLYLKLNTTKISPGEGVGIIVELFYNGTNPIYVNVSNGSVLLPSPYPCGSQVLVGLKVFKGYYTTSNISLAKPLSLYEPGTYFCPLIYAVTQYKLLQLSDQVQLIYNGRVQATLNAEISASLNGCWITNSISSLSGGKFTFFQPGVYTVEAVDYFNQTVLGYFTVT